MTLWDAKEGLDKFFEKRAFPAGSNRKSLFFSCPFLWIFLLFFSLYLWSSSHSQRRLADSDFRSCFLLINLFLHSQPVLSFENRLSEFFCVGFFGLGAVTGSYYLQSLSLDSSLIYLGIQCGLWALSILLINYLRDEEEDRLGGRKHLVTHYGRTHSLLFLCIIQAFIYLLCFFWLGQGLKSGAWCFFLAPFSSILIYFGMYHPPDKKYNFYLALFSLLYTLFGGLWIAGLLL